MTAYAVLAAVVTGVNLLPVLGPPTWLVLVLFRLHQHLAVVPLVAIGALSATAGRTLLAGLTQAVSRRLSGRRVANLRAAGELLRRRRGRSTATVALFLVSPLPSAQLFEAAGVMGLPLRPIAAAFLVGRVVTYSAYVGASVAADRSLGGALRDSLTSWPGLAVQVALLVALWQLGRIDWAARLRRSQRRPDITPPAP